ncbi:uncharacterized protein LOC141674973 [Apium graveolens]|uniref:uncharacterized protein LOC141674973 n=1 Tax=Apium graveolens TaxID=4045 RepID=UPI003D79D755
MGQKMDKGGFWTPGPPDIMSIAWNCRGLANPRAVNFFKELVQQVRPSLIFLSEILGKKKKIEKVCRTIHFADCFVVESHGQGGGFALLWKNPGAVEIKGSCNHYIDFEVVCDQIGRWRYTGFYGCPERYRRYESWELLRGLADESNLPWCVVGDFNEMMFAHEKRGGKPHPRGLLDCFTKTVSDCGLMDMGFVGNEFIWERSRGQYKWIHERLDRGLAN